jgi:glycerophosphoryl diester phosphodiesterase
MYIKRLKKNFTILDANMPIAHEGIYSIKDGVFPNTFKSCKIAIDNNIAFECDIRQTKDNVAVIAHDNVFFVRGKEYKISRLTYKQLQEILGANVPCKLEKVLAYNNGRVPVLVDAKESKFVFYSKYRKNLCQILNEYAKKGEIGLQSFNPIFMLVMRKYLKNVLTLQLVCRAKTILDTFATPKALAFSYEKIISLICVIARTDGINMEYHSDEKWRFTTRFFHDDEVCDKIEDIISSWNKRTDRLQYKLVKAVSDFTKKPVIAFTVTSVSEKEGYKNGLIRNFIMDFSDYGVKGYIKIMKKYQQIN